MVDGFKVICNKCGKEAILNVNGDMYFGDNGIKITSYATGYGGETGMCIECEHCKNSLYSEVI